MPAFKIGKRGREGRLGEGRRGGVAFGKIGVERRGQPVDENNKQLVELIFPRIFIFIR